MHYVSDTVPTIDHNHLEYHFFFFLAWEGAGEGSDWQRPAQMQ